MNFDDDYEENKRAYNRVDPPELNENPNMNWKSNSQNFCYDLSSKTSHTITKNDNSTNLKRDYNTGEFFYFLKKSSGVLGNVSLLSDIPDPQVEEFDAQFLKADISVDMPKVCYHELENPYQYYEQEFLYSNKLPQDFSKDYASQHRNEVTGQHIIAKAGNPMKKVFPEGNLFHDVTQLSKCFKFMKFDEKSFLSIICHRSLERRLEIVEEYARMTKKSLFKDIQKSTSEDMEKFIVSLLLSPSDGDAYWLQNSLKSFVVDLNVVNEILGSRSPEEISKISDSYKKLFGSLLSKDIELLTESSYVEFALKLCNPHRLDNSQVYYGPIKEELVNFYEKSKIKFEKEKVASKMFIKSSSNRIRELNYHFKLTYSNDLITHIKQSYSGTFRNLLVVMCSYSLDQFAHFATLLHIGIEVKDIKVIIRVITSRYNIDLSSILVAYETLYLSSFKYDVITVFKGRISSAIAEMLTC